MAATKNSAGYWLAGADGGVFAFGDAGFHGSAAGLTPTSPVIGIDASRSGYRLVARNGATFSFGGALFAGSLAGKPLNEAITGTATTPAGYLDVAADGGVFTFGSTAFKGSLGGSTIYVPPPPPPPPAPPAPVAVGLPYGLTQYQVNAWTKVSICEEGGNWHVNGSRFAGGLGFTKANWAQFNTFGFPSNAAFATPYQQIRVAVAFAVHYYGSANFAPDQNGCGNGY
jgi:hypothetical protein